MDTNRNSECRLSCHIVVTSVLNTGISLFIMSITNRRVSQAAGLGHTCSSPSVCLSFTVLLKFKTNRFIDMKCQLVL